MKFNKEIRIGKLSISSRSKTFIISEIGVNHNGSLNKAFKLIDESKKCGADAVKFQLFKADNLILKNVKKANYQIKNHKINQSQFEMLKSLEISFESLDKIRQYCEKINIIFIITPYDEKSLIDIVKLKSAAIKIASTDTNNYSFIKNVSKYNLPIIYSTGMTNMNDITEGVKTIHKYNKNLVILQCTSEYPSIESQINLNVINTYKSKFNCLVGFSDHTPGIGASPYAIACGAKVIEKHFTLDKKSSGPDHKSSLIPKEFKLLVNEIRRVELLMGSYDKIITKSEVNNQLRMQKYVVSNNNISAGSKISANDLVFKRTGGVGVKASEYKLIIGKELIKNISSNSPISFKDLK
ncbi:N-acetylneuraminate synthase family protein [Alphaproteobacteria bacterium]|jgi:N,N'-diacetyllegionaminate synthase|nr:N-acetylneuraminate synthase family protein [Alphaproteobacteria bacterium]